MPRIFSIAVFSGERFMHRPSPTRRRRDFRVESLESRLLLASAAPAALTAEIAPGSDPDGNGVVSTPFVRVQGLATPGALVSLKGDPLGAVLNSRADAHGNFHFVVYLSEGRFDLNLQSTDATGKPVSTDVIVARGDALIAWNTTALDAVRAGKTNPPLTARNLAMVQVAVFDAINSIDPLYQAYGGIQVAAPHGASETAAVAGAADEVLRALYPTQTTLFDATLAETKSTSGVGALAWARGEAVGRQVADAILGLRANDGSGAYVNAPVATQPGMWQPTPPAYAKPVGLNFAYVTPFAMINPSQFRPGPPPALTSAEYTAAYNQVKLYGSANSTLRTPDQTAFAKFWSDLPGTTFTPPGHWNQIAQDAAMSTGMSLPAEARLFAVLDIALADAGISCWETKNYYDFWRPVTAIRDGNNDGNPLTVGDPNWTPLWATPAFSSYTSGHATFSAAAATVLDAVFGSHFAFTDPGDPAEHLPARSFASFDQAAAEAAASRMYGGIHFSFDNQTGLQVGKEIGTFVLMHEALRVVPGH
jgi:hypothetical protein